MNLLAQSQNKKQKALDLSLARHDALIARYLAWLSTNPNATPDQRRVTVIARSPASVVVSAIAARGAELNRHNVRVDAIFANLGEAGSLADFFDSVCKPSDRGTVRWARNSRLLDAHEQVTLGNATCWSGDCMRRAPGKRDGLDIFEEDAPDAARLGILAFDAIWAVCDGIPASKLDPAAVAKPSAQYCPDGDRWSAFAFFRKSERSNALPH